MQNVLLWSLYWSRPDRMVCFCVVCAFLFSFCEALNGLLFTLMNLTGLHPLAPPANPPTPLLWSTYVESALPQFVLGAVLHVKLLQAVPWDGQPRTLSVILSTKEAFFFFFFKLDWNQIDVFVRCLVKRRLGERAATSAVVSRRRPESSSTRPTGFVFINKTIIRLNDAWNSRRVKSPSLVCILSGDTVLFGPCLQSVRVFARVTVFQVAASIQTGLHASGCVCCECTVVWKK